MASRRTVGGADLLRNTLVFLSFQIVQLASMEPIRRGFKSYFDADFFFLKKGKTFLPLLARSTHLY